MRERGGEGLVIPEHIETKMEEGNKEGGECGLVVWWANGVGPSVFCVAQLFRNAPVARKELKLVSSLVLNFLGLGL